jgi:DNA (cytosine-5)-methyltransferase 1
MTFGSLFAGIGGMDLGLARAGLTCSWQVEIDPFARRVLEKHWPDVRRWDDVRTFPDGDPDPWMVDLIAGGFPCQDVSQAGKRAGIGGERSGLWCEFARIVRVLRPRYVLVENVGALVQRGLDRVLGDLASFGYDAEWQCLPAAAFGAPHIRDRLFIVAYTDGIRSNPGPERSGRQEGSESCLRGAIGPMGHADRVGEPTRSLVKARVFAGRSTPPGAGGWAAEPDVGRVAHGVPHRVDRVRTLGNAVVPQVAEWIGRSLIDLHE